MQHSPKIRRLVSLLSRLPGVGEKTAQRYVLHLLTADAQIAKDLGMELATLHDELRPCERCGNVAEVMKDARPAEPVTCDICQDQKRDPRVICVVGRVHDLMAIERTGAMRGRYFVLGRLLSPLEGIGPEQLPVPRLVARIKADGVTEVIVATPPSARAAGRGDDAHRERRPARRRPRVRRPDHDGPRARRPTVAVECAIARGV